MANIKRLSEGQNHRCCYCGHPVIFPKEINHHSKKRMATRDHVLAQARGGKNEDNLVIACLLCNNLRGDMDAIAFFNFMQKFFQRNPKIHENWHDVEQDIIDELRIKLLHVHESQLRGLGKHYIEFAFVHFDLIWEQGHRLQV